MACWNTLPVGVLLIGLWMNVVRLSCHVVTSLCSGESATRHQQKRMRQLRRCMSEVMAVCFTLVVGMTVMVWCTATLVALVVGHGSGTVEKVRERLCIVD